MHNVCLFCTRGTPSGLYGQHEIRPTKSIHSENFVDTEEYLIKVNEKIKKFYAGEDGCWGSYTELYRKENGERLTDAVIVFLCMSDEMKFQEMEAVMGELFEKLPVIDKEKKETGQEPKRTR